MAPLIPFTPVDEASKDLPLICLAGGLRRYAHDPRDLSTIAITYFDHPISTWNLVQLQAAQRVREWFDNYRAGEDVSSIPAAAVTDLIEDIGKNFMLDALRDLDFKYFDNETLKVPYGSILGGENDRVADDEPPGKNFIAINPRHGCWGVQPKSARWRIFRQIIFREPVHVFFRRFMHPRYNIEFEGAHHAAWHLLAEVVETRLWTKFGWKVDLLRRVSLFNDFFEKGKRLDVTRQELDMCFKGRLRCIKRAVEHGSEPRSPYRTAKNSQLSYRVGLDCIGVWIKVNSFHKTELVSPLLALLSEC